MAPDPAAPAASPAVAALPARVVDALERVRHACEPERVFLFGSYAAGRAHARSDVDLIVVTSGRGWCTTPQQIRQLFWTLPYDVDAIVLTPQELAEQQADPSSFVSTVLPRAIHLL